MNKNYVTNIITFFLASLSLITPLNSSSNGLLDRNPIYKKVLSNGLTVIVRPVHDMPRVAIQMWYHVGSKDEKSNERGKAHMLEHMVFKGTNTLSESDIGMITNKLSGYCNAHTGYDTTVFEFYLPTQHWQHSFDILADCMVNCTFKDDFINSEMKTVIQEMKGYKDNYLQALFYKVMSSVFEDHPYHYPIIGYKQDLFTINSKSLTQFYKKHYVPNNATLVVVGDVNEQGVLELAQQKFEHIAPNMQYKKESFYFNRDIAQQKVILHRDVQLPQVFLTYHVPGAKEKQDLAIDVIAQILAHGQSSRLHELLVNKLKLTANIHTQSLQLFDHGLFIIIFTPYKIQDVERISQLIDQEISSFATHGFKQNEKSKIVAQIKKAYIDVLESYSAQAREIGRYFLATGDECYLFNDLKKLETIEPHAREIAKQYLRPSLKHTGIVLPINEDEKKHWLTLQQESDIQDNDILSARIRESCVEEGKHVHTIEAQIPPAINLPEAHEFNLKNGMKVFTVQRQSLPKVELTIHFKATGTHYDPQHKQGLYTFMATMLGQGTKKRTNKELDEYCQLHGIELHIQPGSVRVSVLRENFTHALEIIHEVLSQPRFDKKDIEKVRTQILTAIKQHEDDPEFIANKIVTDQLYAGHPYNKQSLGTTESIKRISRKDIMNFYNKVISADGATIAIVGDFDSETITESLNNTLGKIKNNSVEKITYPQLAPVASNETSHSFNRNQVIVEYAGLSVKRTDPDFDKLMLFNKIFFHGMSSKLFKIRMATGLFYFVSGDVINGSDQEPGLAQISMTVSQKNLTQAQEVMDAIINQGIDTITEQELYEAKHNYLNSLSSTLATYKSIAQAYLFLDRYNLEKNYFETRTQAINDITLDEVKTAAKKVLQRDKMILVKVGRV